MRVRIGFFASVLCAAFCGVLPAAMYYDASSGIGTCVREGNAFRVTGEPRDWRAYDFAVIDFLNFGEADVAHSVHVGLMSVDGKTHKTPCHYPTAYDVSRFWLPLKDWTFPRDFAKDAVTAMTFTQNRAFDTNTFQVARVSLVKKGERPATYVWPALVRQRIADRRVQVRHQVAAKHTSALARLPRLPDGRFVGRARGSERVRPRADLPHVTPVGTEGFRVRLARCERENFQVVVTSPRDESEVRVEITDCVKRCPWYKRLWPGEIFAATNIRVSVLGYVETKSSPPNRIADTQGKMDFPEAGWYPHPILDFISACPVKAGDVQSFWVRTDCPAEQAAGIYEGTLRVWFGKTAHAFPLIIRVNDFTLPRVPPLPLAITFSPGNSSSQGNDPDDVAERTRLKRDPESIFGHVAARRYDWGMFLADYGIMYDNLYHGSTNLAWEVFSELKRQGRLGLFNLGTWGTTWQDAKMKVITTNYQEAKRRGLLQHAYIYGFDEAPEREFPAISNAMMTIKRAFPDVPFLTTAFDSRAGVGSALSQIDWFTPSMTTNCFAPDVVAASRAAGHKVWWYTCCFPHAPYPGFFIEAPGIEQRLLMGAMAARAKPDGFLYYQTSIWNCAHEITAGPFTDWNPNSYYCYHGDGSWTCVGPNGMPLATQMLENFRDGLEDLWYVKLLEARGETVDVPEELAKSTLEFSRDAVLLEAWRETLADKLEQRKGK